MQFQSYTVVNAPGLGAIAHAVATRSYTRPAAIQAISGQSAWIVPPGPTEILLLELVISWRGIRTAGVLQLRGADPDPIFTVMQEKGGGHVEIPCHEMSVYLADHGLQAVNNSKGGNYAITAFYQ